ncbi:FecCD family ABC transporter permease [Streptomyces barkulensis]|uniref:FecCD family ABC transporter permease n=1 Tax=Streptomyces barkulensis TaxID=1257026 RepID=UPI0019D2AC14|nr:iron ABC transporter permease [Streptomyces barkulensis]
MTLRKILLRGLLPVSAVLLAVVAASLLLGAGDVGPDRAASVLLGGADGDADARFTVLELRLPRTAVAVAVGAALGVAGAVLQATARNPLAEPGLLGVSAGASFAVVLAIVLGASATTVGPYAAVLGAAAGCLLALGAARLRGAGDDPVRLVLAGAAFSGMVGAASSVLLLVNQRASDEIRFWTVGSVVGRGTDDLMAVLPVLLLGLAAAAAVSPALSSLALGDDVATGLGHRPRRVRAVAVTSVALLVGGATAVAGPVAFVGLVVPFAARALVGPDLRRLLGVSVLLGPAVVLLADVVSRLVVRPYEMPLGVMTALFGAPVLVAVVRSSRLPSL